MLNADLRKQLSVFRLKLRGLPGYLSGISDPVLELGELSRVLGALREEADQLAAAIRDDRERQVHEAELARELEREQEAAQAPLPATAAAAAPPIERPLPEPELLLPSISIRLPQLTGPQILAWSGGVVTLLGIIFFFVLATNRGWIGPVERVLMGAAASAFVFASGVWARRRFEATTAALTAAGAGIAGGYATLLAAAALYDFVPPLTALVVAAAIAALGVYTALLWDSETVAAFGLIGAMLVPATMILQGGVTAIGTAFVAAALIAAGIVALRRGWDPLLIAASVVGAPQIALLVLRADARPASALPVAALFWLAYLALGIARQLSGERKALQALPVSLLLASAGVAATSVARLFDSYADTATLRGLTLLVVAAAYGAVGAALLLRRTNRDLALLVIALGLTAAAVAGADLLSGATLAISWSAEAAVLGWIAWQTKEARFRLSALAYLVLALGHVLAIDAPPSHLFTSGHDPTMGLTSIAALIVAALTIAAFSDFSKRPSLGAWDLLICSPTVLYEAAFLLLWLGQGLASGERAFALGHVMLVSLLAASSLAFVALGNLRDDSRLLYGGLGLLGVTLVEVLFLSSLSPALRWYGLFPFAAALYGVSLSDSVWGDRAGGEVSPVAMVALPAAAFSAALGLHELAGDTVEGTLGLALAAVIALTAVPLARRRELHDDSTLFWLVGLALAAYDVQLLLSGQTLALTLAASALALLALSELTGERRLELAALVAGVWSLVHVFSFETPPRVFVQHVSSPLHGFPSLLALMVVGLGFAWRLRREDSTRHDASLALFAAGLLALLSVWLGVLGFGNAIGGSRLFSFNWAQGEATMLITAAGAVALALGRGRGWSRLWLFGALTLALSLLKLVALDVYRSNAHARGTFMLTVAALLMIAALAEELLGEASDFAKPWASLAPFNLPAMPIAVILAVAGIESIVSPTEIAAIDLAGALETVTGAALFVLALVLLRVRRDAATLLGASAFGAYLFGLAALVARSSALEVEDIAVALALTVVLLAVCVRLRGEQRILLPLAAVAVTAIVFTIEGWTPVSHLITATSHPAAGVLVLLALVLSLLAAALAVPNTEGFAWRRAFSLVTAAAAMYAASLLILQVAQSLGGSVEESFTRGQVVVIAFWGASALVARGLSRAEFPGLSLIVFAIALGVLALLDLQHQWQHLGSYERTAACAALALLALVASLHEQLTATAKSLQPAAAVLALGSPGLGVVAVHEAFGTLRAQGLGLLGLMLAAALVAGALYRFEPEQRDFALLLAALAVVLGVAGIETTGEVVVFLLALLALLATLAGLLADDWRLLGLTLVPIAIGMGESLGGEAAPRLLFQAQEHPGRGVPALAAIIAATAIAVWAARRSKAPRSWAAAAEEIARYVRWALGVGVLYLLSLTVLEVAQAFPGSLQSDFQRGHAAMSACWGVLGLVFLYLGLTRTSKAIRVVGLTLFGASVAKVFLYDLHSLSSVQRAVSFLAVGAMLLAGGFFYQRLAARLTDA